MKHRKPTVQDTKNLDDDALATGRTADAYLGISRTTRHRLTVAGVFPPACKIGGKNRYRMGSLRDFARARSAEVEGRS